MSGIPLASAPCICKTGLGKSTLLANLAISDMQAGAGVMVVDPHGQLVEELLDHVPTERVGQTLYWQGFGAPQESFRPRSAPSMERDGTLPKGEVWTDAGTLTFCGIGIGECDGDGNQSNRSTEHH